MALDRKNIDALNSSDRYQRVEAAITLAAAGETDALPALQALLADPDGLVATTALYATWMLSGELPALDPALTALASDDEEQVQTASGVLTQMGDALLPELQSRLAAQSPYSAPILRLLGDIGGQQALEMVRDACNSKQAEVAATAQQVIDEWDE